MGVGRRGLLLLGAGLLWVIPAWFAPATLLLLLAWNVALVAAWTWDLRRLPSPEALAARRTWSGALGLGDRATVTLQIRNTGRVPIRVRLFDTPPDALGPEYEDGSGWVAREIDVAPGRVAATGYALTPGERGDHDVGELVIRYESDAGLALRWAAAPIGQRVRVYPSFTAARRGAVTLVRSRRMDAELRRARMRGRGRELHHLREFQDGDELRDVAWRATARRGRLITRVYQPERSQPIWIVLDAGRLMRARIGTHLTMDHTADAALALAHVAMQAGDRVGLLAYGRRVQRRLAPARGPEHLRRLADALATVTPEPVEGDHLGAASMLQSLQSRRALVLWLTEMAETAGLPDVVIGAGHLAARHLVVVGVPQPADLTAIADSRPESDDDLFRVMAAQEATERRAALLRSLRERGVLALEWPDGRLGPLLINQYVEIKERNML
ncbi:MAG TPA: DUF58 domain-containing protein [Vicinamibacterales bacterium]